MRYTKLVVSYVIVGLSLTDVAVSQEPRDKAKLYRDTRNGYFMFLPPKGWTPQQYSDPRTKVIFNHPTDRGVFIRFIVREAPGETFDAMIDQDKQTSKQMRSRGIACEVKRNEPHGLKCSDVHAQFPNEAGTMMLRKYLTCGLHFNIQYGAPTKALFAKHLEQVTKSLEAVTVLKVPGGNVTKAQEQQIANRVRLAKLTAQWISLEEGRHILKEAQREFPESKLIRDALKEMEEQRSPAE